MQGTQKAQRVLIVEEDRVEAGIVAFHLRRAGYKPLLVSSGDEAADAVAWGTPDAVVAELSGPGVNGLEFAAALSGKSLVFLLVADRPLTGDEELSALRLRLHHVVQKPIDPDSLVEQLRRATPHPLGPAQSDRDGDPVIRGSLADRSVVSLVRMASRHAIDCVLEVSSEGPAGWLVMRGGQIVDAALGDSVAKAAAVDLLLREHGQFGLRPLGLDDPDLQRLDSVQCDLAQLVAEAMAKATTRSEPEPGPEPPREGLATHGADPRPRAARARQVGIPATTTHSTLPDAAQPIPSDAPFESPPGAPDRSPPAASEAAKPDNLPWWKPPPLKGFQAPKAATARRRGNRLQVNTRPRVRKGEPQVAPAPEARSVRAQRTTGSHSAGFQRVSTGPAGGPKPATKPQGMAVAEVSDDPLGTGSPRKITRPGMQATDPSQALLDELAPPSAAPQRLASKRRSAGPVISKGTPQVLSGPPRARLKPPPFKRPKPPGPPPADGDGTAKRRRGPRRFQTAGRMKAIEPSADLAAAYREFRDEHGIDAPPEAVASRDAAAPTADPAGASATPKTTETPEKEQVSQSPVPAPTFDAVPPEKTVQDAEAPAGIQDESNDQRPSEPGKPIEPDVSDGLANPGERPRDDQASGDVDGAPIDAASAGRSERPSGSDAQAAAADTDAAPTASPAAELSQDVAPPEEESERAERPAVEPTGQATQTAQQQSPPLVEDALNGAPQEALASAGDREAPEATPDSERIPAPATPPIAEGATSETGSGDLDSARPSSPVAENLAPARHAPEEPTDTAASPSPPTTGAASQDSVSADASEGSGLAAQSGSEEERVRGRLVPRTFFEDGERPVRKLRSTSHPHLAAATGDDPPGDTAEADPAPAPATVVDEPSGEETADPKLDAPSGDSAATDEEDDWGYHGDESSEAHDDEPSIALSGLTAAPPTAAPSGPNFKAINIVLGLILVAVSAFVIHGIATRESGSTPKPGASAAAPAVASDSFEARLGKATLALENNRLEEASKQFKALALEKPDDATVVSGWAMASYGQRDWANAKAAFETLRELKPEEPQVYYHLTYVYAALKDNESARKAAAKFNTLAPADSPDAKKIQDAMEKAGNP